MKRLIVELPDKQYENIIALAATNIVIGGRFPYKGIVQYAINAIKKAEIIDDKAADEEATTKKDLGVDCISRKQAQDEVYWKCQRWSLSKAGGGYGQDVWNDYMISSKDAMQVLKELPSVYPKSDKPSGKWIDELMLYIQDRYHKSDDEWVQYELKELSKKIKELQNEKNT